MNGQVVNMLKQLHPRGCHMNVNAAEGAKVKTCWQTFRQPAYTVFAM